MKHFRSEHAFEKYRPHLSWRQKIARFFRKKQYNAVPIAQPTHYKTNPFKQKKDVGTSKFKLILLVIVLSFWVACLAYIPYFKINKITYSGLENNTEAELGNIIYPNYLNPLNHHPLKLLLLFWPQQCTEYLTLWKQWLREMLIHLHL